MLANTHVPWYRRVLERWRDRGGSSSRAVPRAAPVLQRVRSAAQQIRPVSRMRRAAANSIEEQAFPSRQRSLSIPPLLPLLLLRAELSRLGGAIYRLFKAHRLRVLLALLAGSSCYMLWILYRAYKRHLMKGRKREFDQRRRIGDAFFDAIVVGGGPSGSTCAFYLARNSTLRGHALRVLVIEGRAMPRDKVCGDLIAPPAQHHLQQMSLLPDLLAHGIGKWIAIAGLVGPRGSSFVCDTASACANRAVSWWNWWDPSRPREDMLNIQRVLLDERMLHAAHAAGAEVMHATVTGVERCADDAPYWRVHCLDSSTNSELCLYARMLIGADGATSTVGKCTGLVVSEPNGMCARTFAKVLTALQPGTHVMGQVDHVIVYPLKLKPGFVTLTREMEDYVSVCCYLMPVTASSIEHSELESTFRRILERNSTIRSLLGPHAVLTPIQSCSMRVGGVKHLVDDALLLIGDAAGQLDALTGQGVQYGLTAANIAAQVALRGFEAGDLSKGALSEYQQRVDWAFGWELWLSLRASEITRRYPFLIDGVATVVRRNGDDFFEAWCAVRSGQRSKLWFMRPDVCALILVDAVLQYIASKFAREER